MPKKPVTICYLCGKQIRKKKEKSKDHVPPKHIFPSEIRRSHNLSELLTLPTHKKCNAKYREDEEYFVASAGTIRKDNPVLMALWKDIGKSVKRPEGKKFGQRILSESLDRLPMSGLIVPGKAVKTMDKFRIDRVMEKIARGLLYHHYGKVLPAQIQYNCFYYGPRAIYPLGSSEKKIAETVTNERVIVEGKYKNIFAYRRLLIEPMIFGTWAFLFWNAHVFIYSHHGVDCEGVNCRCLERLKVHKDRIKKTRNSNRGKGNPNGEEDEKKE